MDLGCGCLGVVLGEPVLPDSEKKAQQATFFSVCHSRGGCEPELREDVAHEVGARLFSSLTAHVGFARYRCGRTHARYGVCPGPNWRKHRVPARSGL